MPDAVDAIRYHLRTLDDLNISVQKEQETAQQLARYVDRKSGEDSLRVIEKFLEVYVDFIK